jgi:hypothetical protein
MRGSFSSWVSDPAACPPLCVCGSRSESHFHRCAAAGRGRSEPPSNFSRAGPGRPLDVRRGGGGGRRHGLYACLRCAGEVGSSPAARRQAQAETHRAERVCSPHPLSAATAAAVAVTTASPPPPANAFAMEEGASLESALSYAISCRVGRQAQWRGSPYGRGPLLSTPNSSLIAHPERSGLLANLVAHRPSHPARVWLRDDAASSSLLKPRSPLLVRSCTCRI